MVIGSIGGVIGLVVESPLEEGFDGVEEIKEEEKPLIEVENHIKDEYTSDESLKIELHKKINEIDSYEKLDEVKKALGNTREINRK